MIVGIVAGRAGVVVTALLAGVDGERDPERLLLGPGVGIALACSQKTAKARS